MVKGFAFLVTGLILIAAPGCSRTDRLKTVPVSGIVTLDGQPLKMGSVIFTPANGRAATGQIQADGTYVLGTYEEDDGAILGTHQVSVTAREELPPDPGGLPEPSYGPSQIPEFYGYAATSGLQFEVVDGENDIPIELSSQPPGAR